MFTELLPRAMQELLWEQRSRITSVQVFSMEPFIPWELVYLKDPRAAVIGEDSRFLGELGLVRWLYEGYPPARLTLRSGRACYVIPSYTGALELPESATEEMMLKRLFKGARRVAPRALDVQELVRTPGSFDLLHFAGHAEAAGEQQADARLVLRQAGDGTTEEALFATTVEQTARLKAGGRQPIVVLNACESARMRRSFASMGGFASAFVARGAGVFIGTLWSVGDAPARTFIEEFYRSFAGRKAGTRRVQLREAVAKARRAARNGGDATWLAYVVYGHPNARVG
jgi:CHAT domain-containing protein